VVTTLARYREGPAPTSDVVSGRHQVLLAGVFAATGFSALGRDDLVNIGTLRPQSASSGSLDRIEQVPIRPAC
jgi:hypothetical protein